MTTEIRVRRGTAVLVASIAGAAVVALDGTVLLIAQPALARDLDASVGEVQWTSTAYLIMVAGLLVTAGRLGDRYGHARLLWTGALGFGLASAGIMLAPTIGWVIALRALQGIFAALLQPATLALLRLDYPPDRLPRAIGIRTSAIGVAAAAGPALGGLLVAHAGWRSVFAINLPIALLIVAIAVRLDHPSKERPPLTPANALLLVLPLAALIFIPKPVTRSRPVMASMTLLLIITSGLFGTLFLATFRLQERLSPEAAGVHVLPMTILMVLGAPIAGIALRRYGARSTGVAGSILVASGVALSPVSSLAFPILGAGFATVMVTATGTAVGDAPAGYAGSVSGLKQTAMNLGPTIGIAIAGASQSIAVLAVLTAAALIPAVLLPTGESR